jgi:arylsulfatase A-like enzyme
LRTTGAAAVSALMPLSAHAAKRHRPNIILMFADDHAQESMGYAGNPVIKTPNMDRLAADGVFFENSFVTTPICCCSRASVLTGQYMRRHGIEDFRKPLSAEAFAQTYPMILCDAGYRTAYLGKFAIGRPDKDIKHLSLPADKFDFWYGFPQDFSFKQNVGGETCYLTDLMTTKAIDFMKSTPKDQPFCMTLAFKEPHGPLDYFDPDFPKCYEDTEIPKPITLTQEAYDKMPDFIRHSLNGSGDTCRFLNNDAYQSYMRQIYNYVSRLDQAVGVVMDALHAVGLADNTIVIYASDNGSFLGAHGLSEKWLLYEESIRVPLIVWDGRLPKRRRGIRHEAIALNIDWAPTMLDYAGVPIPETMQGKSLRPLVEGAKKAVRKDAYFEHTYVHQNNIRSSEGVRSKDWKYIRYFRQEPVYEELFHLTNDPEESHNLAGDAKQASSLKRLRERCDEFRRALA